MILKYRTKTDVNCKVLHLAAFTGKGWSQGIVGGAGGVWAVTPKGIILHLIHEIVTISHCSKVSPSLRPCP